MGDVSILYRYHSNSSDIENVDILRFIPYFDTICSRTLSYDRSEKFNQYQRLDHK